LAHTTYYVSAAILDELLFRKFAGTSNLILSYTWAVYNSAAVMCELLEA
jgi:hypothetical protein